MSDPNDRNERSESAGTADRIGRNTHPDGKIWPRIPAIVFFDELFSQDDRMALYCDGRVAFLPLLEYQELILSLEEHARRKVLGLTRRRQAQRTSSPHKPWRP